MRRSLPFFGLLAILAGPGVADEGTEERLIVAAQTVPVRELDDALPPVPLAEWLGALARHPSELVWEVNDCGEQTGGPADTERDFPACVEAIVPVGPARAHVGLMVGTFRRGVVGKPKLFQLYVERDGKYRALKKLSELRALAGGQDMQQSGMRDKRFEHDADDKRPCGSILALCRWEV